MNQLDNLSVAAPTLLRAMQLEAEGQPPLPAFVRALAEQVHRQAVNGFCAGLLLNLDLYTFSTAAYYEQNVDAVLELLDDCRRIGPKVAPVAERLDAEHEEFVFQIFTRLCLALDLHWVWVSAKESSAALFEMIYRVDQLRTERDELVKLGEARRSENKP